VPGDLEGRLGEVADSVTEVRSELHGWIAGADGSIKQVQEGLAILAGSVAALEQGGNDGPPKLADGHIEWSCECCRLRLGIYDRQRDIMRIRVKDYFVRIRVGEGGHIDSPCRRCGQQNRIGFTPVGGR